MPPTESKDKPKHTTLVAMLGAWKRVAAIYWKKIPTALKALATIVVALNAAWQLYTHLLSTSSETAQKGKTSASLSVKSSETHKTDDASKEKITLPLPDKPLLPFTNMSNDPKQEYLVDGLTEEIINTLSKFPQVFVIARNSSFTYKGKPVDIKQVGREMGVQYVLEGSLRREVNRIRITAQLIDSNTGLHVFSERYDRQAKDIFAMQDDIAIRILTALRVTLQGGEWANFHARGVKNAKKLRSLLSDLE